MNKVLQYKEHRSHREMKQQPHGPKYFQNAWTMKMTVLSLVIDNSGLKSLSILNDAKEDEDQLEMLS